MAMQALRALYGRPADWVELCAVLLLVLRMLGV